MSDNAEQCADCGALPPGHYLTCPQVKACVEGVKPPPTIYDLAEFERQLSAQMEFPSETITYGDLLSALRASKREGK